MKIKSERSSYTSSNKRLRRARHLFIFLCCRKLLAYDNDYLKLYVERCREYKLFADATSDKDIRSLTARRLFKIHNPNKLNWYEWYAGYRWQTNTWEKEA